MYALFAYSIHLIQSLNGTGFYKNPGRLRKYSTNQSKARSHLLSICIASPASNNIVNDSWFSLVKESLFFLLRAFCETPVQFIDVFISSHYKLSFSQSKLGLFFSCQCISLTLCLRKRQIFVKQKVLFLTCVKPTVK